MSRVSEQSSIHSINYSVGKTKSKLEDLQIQGSNLKKIQKPSDDPIGNIELLSIRSRDIDDNQFLRNSSYAKTLLELTESTLESMTELIGKAKEIAIGQSSDLYNPEVRQSVAKEVHQLRIQALSLANRRVGNRYIFSGYKTLTKPFDMNGKYLGDDGKINLEVSKDFFVPINLNGSEVFFSNSKKEYPNDDIDIRQLEMIEPSMQNEEIQQIDEAAPQAEAQRNLASQSLNQNTTTSIFDNLQSLENALLTNNPDVVQNILDNLDEDHNRVVKLRTQIGAISNSISNSENTIESQKLMNAAYKSKIEDADIAELFGEISKQQNVLKATYKSTAGLLNSSLLDFVR